MHNIETFTRREGGSGRGRVEGEDFGKGEGVKKKENRGKMLVLAESRRTMEGIGRKEVDGKGINGGRKEKRKEQKEERINGGDKRKDNGNPWKDRERKKK